MDYASATPVSQEVQDEVRRIEAAAWANPGSIHAEGVRAKQELDQARRNIGQFLGCRSRNLIFTSGATEANNLALLGVFKQVVLGGKGAKETHWIVSAMEHPSVLACFEHMRDLGASVSLVRPGADGRINPEHVQALLRDETVLVSIGWANSEIGVVQPISAIAKVVHAHSGERKVLLHSDAGQAPLYRKGQVHSLGVDLLSLDAGKLYGPRGIGALYVSDDAELAPQIVGGGQERGLRAGTPPTALAAGFAAALKRIAAKRESETKRMEDLQRQCIALLQKEKALEGMRINGSEKDGLPHIINISIPNIDSEYLVLALDHHGLAVSTKSSCREGEAESHVVRALGLKKGEEWRARNTVRISFGEDTTLREVQAAVRTIALQVHEHPRSKIDAKEKIL